jgi:ATP-dependent Clp protease ATP-binding subunit ClpA
VPHVGYSHLRRRLSEFNDPPVREMEKVERTAVEAARRKFSPEFMNRLDKVVVFHPLKRTDLDEVLEIELGQV